MRIRGKRFLVCCTVLNLMCCTLSGTSVFAEYVAPGSYNTTIDGNGTGEKRMTVTSGVLKSFSFSNIKQKITDRLKGGALNFASDMNFDTNSITDFYFENNQGYYGGAMSISSEMMPVEVFNSKFLSNTSDSDGGAIYDTTSIQIEDSIFENNRAIDGKGGALFFKPDGNDIAGMSKIVNTDFINNAAGREGGAMYVDTSSGGQLYFSIDDNQTHYMSGNIQNAGKENESSNAMFIEKGTVNITTSGDNSKFVIDDGIEGGNADKLDSAKVNYRTNYGGTLVLNNQVKNLTFTQNSGNLLLNHGDKLPDGTPIFNNVDLLLKPGDGGWNKKDMRFDLANGKLDTLLIRNLTVTEEKGDQKFVIAVDVDLNQGKSDIFNVIGTTNGALKFDADHFELNILNDGDTDSFQLFDGVPLTFLTGELIQYGESEKYKFTAGDNGIINVSVQDSSGLPEAVASTEETRRYVALKNIKLDQALGAMGGKSLIVNMKNFILNGNKNKGITVAAGQKLSIENAGSIDGASLNNFQTDGNGSVVNNIGGEVTVVDSVITDNKAEGKGGALYALGGKINLNAETMDVIFKNNTHELKQSGVDTEGVKNDIYLENTTDGTKAALNINGSKNTILESGIAGNGEITKNDIGIMKLGGDNSNFTGDVRINGGEIQLLSGATYFNAQNTYIADNSRVNLINNNPNDVVNFGNLNLEGTAKVSIDIDGTTRLNDKIGALRVAGDGKILIDDVNVMSLGDGTAQFDIIKLDETTKDSPLLGLVELSPNAANVKSPIFKYQTKFDSNTGIMSLSTGSRNDKNSYNPSILATSVALQAAAQAGIKEAINHAFEHTDSYTKLPISERLAMFNSNKYAISEFNEQLPSYNNSAESNALWFRPYTVFESINLHRGPKVDNLSYGTLIGFDGGFKERRKGWMSTTSSFLGYHGSNLDYADVDINSNGVLLGVTKNYYKRNFWTALTMSGNVGMGKIHEMYGSDNIAYLNGALSSRTGYNFEFAKGKLIAQPNVALSYYMSKVFDYINEADVKINSNPLHSFEIKPGVRIIGNTKEGWQPYLSAAMVWNLFNGTDVMANGFKLPEMSMKPYIEYGLGLQKIKNDNFTCYLQSLVRNGGRTGVSLMGGLSWTIGQNKEEVKEQIKEQPKEQL